jgi:hypothetical protein
MPNSTLERLFSLCDGFRSAALVHFANQAGLWSHLAEGSSASTLASTMGWSERRTVILLRALAAERLCDLEGDGVTFKLDAGVAPYLLPDSPAYVGDVLEHSRLQWNLWQSLGAVMSATVPHPLQQDVRLRDDREASDVFNRAMQQLAGGLIEDVVSHTVFADAVRVIDLAGGHGDYLVAVAQAYPQVIGEVWDFASSAEFAQLSIAQRGLDARLAFTAIDVLALTDPPRSDADAVMVNDCLHYFDGEGMRQVLRLAGAATKPGGAVSVVTPWLEAGGIEPTGTAGFSFYMMVNAYSGGVHTVPEVMAAMEDVGLTEIDVARVGELDDSAHIVGRSG